MNPNGPVFHGRVGFSEVHADGYGLRRGGHFMAWTDVEWITLSDKVDRTTHYGMYGGVSVTTKNIQAFTVGCGGQKIPVTWTRFGNKVNGVPRGWVTLIELATAHLIPRLADQTAARLRAGTVVFDDFWVLDSYGFYIRLKSLSQQWRTDYHTHYQQALRVIEGESVVPIAWSEVTGIRAAANAVAISAERNGYAIPIPQYSMAHRNVVVLPQVIHRMKRG